MGYTRTVVFAQGKGGVGKTSLTANVAGLAAASGLNVLAVDLDPQGNLARDLGYEQDSGQALMAALITGGAPPVLPEVRPGLDVVPGGAEVGDAAAIAISRDARGGAGLGQMLHATLGHVVGPYDLVVIDSPPGERMIVEACLQVASYVVAPVRSDEASLDALSVLASRFVAVRERNPSLQLAGVVLFAIGARSRRIQSRVRRAVSEIVGAAAPTFETHVRHLESAAFDARSRGLLIHELEGAVEDARAERLRALRAGSALPDGPLVRDATRLAEDYEALTRELLQRISALEEAESA